MKEEKLRVRAGCEHEWDHPTFHPSKRDRYCEKCGGYQTEEAALLEPPRQEAGGTTVRLLSFGSDGAGGELIAAVTFVNGQPLARTIGSGTPTPRLRCDALRELGALEDCRRYGL